MAGACGAISFEHARVDTPRSQDLANRSFCVRRDAKASSRARSIGCHAWLVHYKWRTTLRSRTAKMTIRAELACAAWDHRGPTILEPLAWRGPQPTRQPATSDRLSDNRALIQGVRATKIWTPHEANGSLSGGDDQGNRRTSKVHRQ
jgi:hypothetical protein